ncbi:MAG: valine--tRNA ligase [Endozoicomonadaceae bacterium]|nr:valine--tRNA ligase [Endozoicomonadaceae bacterium]
MDTTYTPKSIESNWYQYWQEKNYFAPKNTGASFCTMLPPPNITGTLHMGHAFQQSIIDALTRYKRMKGFRTLWQSGTDHAGIATQMLVERQLQQAENTSRHTIGRTAFVQKIWEWKNKSGHTITKQMRRLGTSVDWSTEKFTMDDSLSRSVTTAFIQLYQEDLVYRSKKLINWDPTLQTAISDLEVINELKTGELVYLRYAIESNQKIKNSAHFLVIATTRPETLLGDAAIAIHPEDDRYQHLIGQKVRIPLVNRLIPIIADSAVERDFGTGCVKITPAHDFNDYEMAKRHHLPLINILNKKATLLTQAEVFNLKGILDTTTTIHIPKEFHGLNCIKARQLILVILKKQEVIDKIIPHKMNIPTGDRSGSIIEPFLTDQWFISMESLAKPAITAVKTKKITFIPSQYENLYLAWMKDIQDWCISRQLWWGHRIPAWYDPEGHIYVGENLEAIRKTYQLEDNVILVQDEDVFDTWFSSALWTFSTLGWPDQTEKLATFHPTQVLVTGFDIIFFWVARMIMMSLHLVKTADNKPAIPFETVYIHGLIRDENGQKMSKSKGNVLDPLDMIDGISLSDLVQKRTMNMMQPHLADQIAKQTKKAFPNGILPHGTDALRYTLYSLASTGRNINWDMNRLTGFRNFCNKIWNASRYVILQTENKNCHFSSETNIQSSSLSDQWIISRLQHTIESVCNHMDQFRLDLVSQSIYSFIWHDYCDWYLELTKPILMDKTSDPISLQITRSVLIYVLETALRLAHPFIPFITEEIWQKIKLLLPDISNQDSIMMQAYPECDKNKMNAQVEDEMEWLQVMISAMRSIRKKMKVAYRQSFTVFCKHATLLDQKRIQQNTDLLIKISNLDKIIILNNDDTTDLIGTTELVGTLELIVPLTDLINTDQELIRLDQEIEKNKSEQIRIENKLSQPQFIQRAPAAIVEKEKEKLMQYKKILEQLFERKIIFEKITKPS